MRVGSYEKYVVSSNPVAELDPAEQSWRELFLRVSCMKDNEREMRVACLAHTAKELFAHLGPIMNQSAKRA